MPAPKTKDARKAEVKTWTEEISGPLMGDLLDAVLSRPTKISRQYDIPYVAGYSRDGRTIFIDRHMPRSHRFHGGDVDTDQFIALHEIVEKALLDQLRLHYLHAHQIALRTEQAPVRAAGISWRDYDRFTKKNSKKIEREKLARVPGSLDLTPYVDEDDFDTLRDLVRARS
jgi:hypothetical protein